MMRKLNFCLSPLTESTLAGWRSLALWSDGGKLESGCLTWELFSVKRQETTLERNIPKRGKQPVKYLVFVLSGLFCLFILVLLCPSFVFVAPKVCQTQNLLSLSWFPLPLALQFAEHLGEQHKRQIHFSNSSPYASFHDLKFSRISSLVWFIARKRRTQLEAAVCNRYEKEGKYFMLLLSPKIDL